MPALVFYGGFRSFLAGDDLIVVSRVALAIRLAQLIVLVTVTTMTSDSFYRLRQDVDKLKASCGLSEDFVFRRETLVNRSFEISAAYLISAYLTTIFGAVLEIMIARASSKGTPTRQDERASLKYLCCIKMIPLSLLRVLNTLLGILVIFVLRERCSCGFTQSDYTLECPDVPVWYGWVSGLVVTHFIEAAFVALFAAMFLKKTAGRAPLPSCFNSETKWKLLCKCCCTVSALLTCCFYGGTDSDTTDFADIGIILADFFDSGGKLDIVISDIMLGLRMLARVQKRRQDAARKELIDMIHTEGGTRGNSDDRETKEEEEEEEDCDDANMAEFLANIAEGQESEHEIPLATEDDGDSRGKSKRKRSVVYQIKRDKTSPHGLVQPTTRTVLVVGNKRDALAIAEGARFIQLSNSIYEFRITALQTSFLQACSRLTESGRRVAYWCTTKAEETADQTIPLGIPVGAGFQMANNTGRKLLELTGLKDAGMELVYVQFGVGLARQPYCISLDNDWKSIVIAIRGTYSLDDVVADLTMLPESLKEWGEKCGFDSEDCFVHSGMLKSSVWIYNDLETHGIVDDLLRIPEYSDYTIRLTGHSLGAGCAAILSFMLRKKHPNLRCHCFCPPGCTMSENMADRCKDYLTSYIFDHDIVPRLTLDSMDHFRDDIFEMIARVKVAKREAIKAGPDVSEEVLLYGSNNVPPSRYSEQLKLLHEYQENIRSKRHTRGVPLFPPGQIVHLVRTSGQEVNTTGCCLGRAPAADGAENQAEIRRSMDYAARWAHRSDLAEIVISSHMVSDHSAPNMLSELAATADLFGIASPFLVQQDDI